MTLTKTKPLVHEIRDVREQGKRKAFSEATKTAVRERSGGKCEASLIPRRYGLPVSCKRKGVDLDHINPVYNLGDNEVTNCALLCKACHGIKTAIDHKEAQKCTRVFKKNNDGCHNCIYWNRPKGKRSGKCELNVVDTRLDQICDGHSKDVPEKRKFASRRQSRGFPPKPENYVSPLSKAGRKGK